MSLGPIGEAEGTDLKEPDQHRSHGDSLRHIENPLKSAFLIKQNIIIFVKISSEFAGNSAISLCSFSPLCCTFFS